LSIPLELKDRLEALFRLAKSARLAEFSLRQPGFGLSLKTVLAPRPKEAAPSQIRSPAPPSASAPAAASPRSTIDIRSPLTGVFYRTPSPGAAPFVEVGDEVEEGQTVCLVEAMKVFNEIVSDWAGRVTAIPAQEGKLVADGEVLVVLEPRLEAAD